MNPLSALRVAMNPELRAASVAQQASVGAVKIPQSDIAKLPSSMGPGEVQAGQGGSFSNVLGDLVRDVNGKQAAASDSVNGLLTGQNVSLHQAMISMEEASVSFQLMVEVRNKLLEGYQELMRMQV